MGARTAGAAENRFNFRIADKFIEVVGTVLRRAAHVSEFIVNMFSENRLQPETFQIFNRQVGGIPRFIPRLCASDAFNSGSSGV